MAFHSLPEGTALARRREGLAPTPSVFCNRLSDLVEPLAAVAAAAALTVTAVLPYAMGCAAVAMIYAVVRELPPETQASGHSPPAPMAFMGGFLLMMALDIILG